MLSISQLCEPPAGAPVQGPVYVMGKVQMVWKLRDCGSNNEDDGPLSSTAEKVFNFEIDDDVVDPSIRLSPRRRRNRRGASRIGVFLYDNWALECNTIQRKVSL